MAREEAKMRTEERTTEPENKYKMETSTYQSIITLNSNRLSSSKTHMVAATKSKRPFHMPTKDHFWVNDNRLKVRGWKDMS